MGFIKYYCFFRVELIWKHICLLFLFFSFYMYWASYSLFGFHVFLFFNVKVWVNTGLIMLLFFCLLTGIVVTNDGNAILRELDLAHPAAKA